MFARFHIFFPILGRHWALSWGRGLSTLALATAGVAGLGACGQKGPLFLPPPPKAAVPTTGGTPIPSGSATPSATTPATSDLPQPPPASRPTFTPR